MWRELLITDVTRMGEDRVCIAGLDIRLNTVRLVLPAPGIPETKLYSGEQVVIRPRAVVRADTYPMIDCLPPHTEDHEWRTPDQTECLRLVDDAALLNVLRRTKSPTVAAIFETELRKNRQIKPGTGRHSLGTIQPRRISALHYKRAVWEDREKTDCRLNFTDETGGDFRDIIIKDLSLCTYADYLYHYSGWPAEQIDAHLLDKFAQTEVWLRLGLAREWNGWCWLQVTAIYTFPDYLNGECFVDFKV